MEGKTISKLFDPIELNNIRLKNRIVMAPMTRSRAIGNVPNDLIAQYYRQRATAGLIVTEGVAPSPEGLGYARTPGIYSPEQIAGWKKVTSAVHEEGGKIFAQIMHSGRIGNVGNKPGGAAIMAPSAVRAQGDIWTDTEGMQAIGIPHAMTTEQVRQTIEDFANGAANAIEAGFDGIELHGANGYLIEQFLNPNTNTRTDEFGGSIANRIHFVIELVKAVIDRIGKERTAIRLSPYNQFNDMALYDEIFATYDLLTKELNNLGVVYVHVIDRSALATEEGKALIAAMRKNYNGAYILNGGYSVERADEAINSGLADLISFGSSFIANPDLPYRLQYNIPLAQPDVNLFYSAGAEGLVDYPVATEKVA